GNQNSDFVGKISHTRVVMTTESILNQAINSRISGQEARRFDLSASDDEVRDLIVKQFTDPTTGNFDVKNYKEYVTRNFGSVPLYEQSIRNALAAEKLRAFVTAGVQVSEGEVKENFLRENTSFDLTYVPITADELSKKISPSEDDMRQYFDAHKTDYRFQFPQKKIRYRFISQ